MPNEYEYEYEYEYDRRAIVAIESKAKEERENETMLGNIKIFKTTIEQEIEEVCKDIIDIIEKSLVPNCETDESKVFYLKMKGDYHR